MTEWWREFFDEQYLRLAAEMFSEDENRKQAADIWAMLDLKPGCRILDAPCGWGRLSRRWAELGGEVLGIDQSGVLISEAERQRDGMDPGRLRYLQHDFRVPLAESGFDVACNIFTSFGYGTEDDDVALFRTLRQAVRPGGRVLIETNHRDLVCSFLTRGGTHARKGKDGTLFLDEPSFDPIGGVVTLNWYWSGPNGSGEKHAYWRCYTPTEIVELVQRAGLQVEGVYSGLTRTPYGKEIGRMSVIGVKETGSAR